MTSPSPAQAPRPSGASRDGVTTLEPVATRGVAEQVHEALAGPGTHVLLLVVDGSQTGWDDAAVLAVADSSVPVVALLRADVTSHAAAVALAADLRVADPGVTVRVEPLLGATSATLPRAVGAATARLLMLDPRTLDAQAAHGVGLVHGLRPTAAEAREAAADLAARVAAAPGLGAAVRRALDGGRLDLGVVLEDEARLRAVASRHGRR